MKKLFIVLAFVFVLSSAYVFAAENTFELCNDGIDNNANTLIDSSDPECSGVEESEVIAEVVIETELCTDGIDNDGDTLVDSSDPNCATALAENSAQLCSDEADNDGDTLVDASDPDCISFIPDDEEEIEITNLENTLQLCTDGTDNDGDTLVDASDPDCISFIPDDEEEIEITNLENTAQFCIDGTDNDGDTLVDASDPDCAQVIQQEQAPQPEERSGGSGGRSSRGAVAGASIDTESEGEVLGESIDFTNTCTPLLAYMRMGQDNPSDQVMVLQAFLNAELGTTLPITGFFGPMTDAAVRQFQIKYTQDVLQPWVDAGLYTNNNATGYVYKTTLYKINVMRCPSLEFTIPVLK